MSTTEHESAPAGMPSEVDHVHEERALTWSRKAVDSGAGIRRRTTESNRGPVSALTKANRSQFAVGDRVVVSERYRGAGCNHGAIGFYGHVISFDDAPSRWDRYVHVAFRGHINGPSAEGFDHYMTYGDDHPFPCYAFELDHAD